MRAQKADRTTAAFEKALAARDTSPYVLRLYVAGASSRSRQAIRRVRQLCDADPRSCELEVIDIFQQPILAREGQIVATPTLVKLLPRPLRRFIGSLADATDLFSPVSLSAAGKVRP